MMPSSTPAGSSLLGLPSGSSLLGLPSGSSMLGSPAGNSTVQNATGVNPIATPAAKTDTTDNTTEIHRPTHLVRI